MKVPPTTFADGAEQKWTLAQQVYAVYNDRKQPLPPALSAVYNADACSLATDYLKSALETRSQPRRPGGPMVRVFIIESAAERKKALDLAEAWAKSGGAPPELMHRIAKAKEQTR